MSSSSSFFSFPNPVNDVAARTVATGVVLMGLAAAGLGWGWILIPLTYGFLARVASGPRFSPLGLIATKVVAPRLPQFEKLVPGPPKRFAQAIGVAFTVTASALWLAGMPGAARVVVGFLVLAAGLEAALGFCLGCKVFALLMRAGVIPEDVCAECNDISLRIPGLSSSS
ncbi:MAG: DUF4395 domain-containing protein, partial [Actinobacteria bacterium]|nr:DUF4395 domain-containing protein [Actinomycetota bacterium]